MAYGGSIVPATDFTVPISEALIEPLRFTSLAEVPGSDRLPGGGFGQAHIDAFHPLLSFFLLLRQLALPRYVTAVALDGATCRYFFIRVRSKGMSTVTEIIEAVKRLDERAKGEFLAELAEIDFDDAWDRQIEADAKAGRLDFLWEEAMVDVKAGRVKALDEVLGDP